MTLESLMTELSLCESKLRNALSQDCISMSTVLDLNAQRNHIKSMIIELLLSERKAS